MPPVENSFGMTPRDRLSLLHIRDARLDLLSLPHIYPLTTLYHPPKNPIDKAPMDKVPFKVKALYEYKSEHEDDLNFAPGMVITVTEVEDDEWYSGYHGAESGMFPKNFVELIKEEPATPAVPRHPEPAKQEPPVAKEPEIKEHQPEPIEKKEVPKPAVLPGPGLQRDDPYAVKKQFAGAGKSSYVPQVKPRDQSNIVGHTHHDVAKNAEVVREHDKQPEEEEADEPKMSLKERIAILQKRQQEEAEREAAALKRKEERKKKMEEEKERVKLQKEAQALSATSTGASLDRHASEGEDVDSIADKRSLAESVPSVPGHDVAPSIQEEEEEETHHAGAGADEEEEEDEDEDEDEEELKRRRLVERMAKISGGRNMFGMMGMPTPFGAPATSKPKKTKTKSVDETEASEATDVPAPSTEEPDVEEEKPAAPAVPASAVPIPGLTQPGVASTPTEEKPLNTATAALKKPQQEDSSIAESDYTDEQNVPVTNERKNFEQVEESKPKSPTLELSESEPEQIDRDERIDLGPRSTYEGEVTGYEADEDVSDRGAVSKDLLGGNEPPLPLKLPGAPPVPGGLPPSEPPAAIPESPASQPPTPSTRAPPPIPGSAPPSEPSTRAPPPIPGSAPPTEPTSRAPPPIPGSLPPSESGSRAPPPVPTGAPLAPPPIPLEQPAPPSTRPEVPSSEPPVPAQAPPAPRDAPPTSKLPPPPPIPTEQPLGQDAEQESSDDETEFRDTVPDQSRAPERVQTFSHTPSVPQVPISRANTTDSTRRSFESHKRRSSDLSRLRSIGKAEQLQADTYLPVLQDELNEANESSGWWIKDAVPDSMEANVGTDFIFEVDRQKLTKRGGREVVLKDYYILFHDLSQIVLELQYESDDPRTTLSVTNAYVKPPVVNRRDVLDRYHSQYGSAVVNAAQGLVNSRVSNGFANTVFQQVNKATDGALLSPIGNKSYGVTVYKNQNGSATKYDDIKPGDILCMKHAKFTAHGLGGLSTKTVTYGDGNQFFNGVIVEIDHKKDKLRVLDADDSGAVKKESFKINDLKSGRLRVFRFVDRQFVGW